MASGEALTPRIKRRVRGLLGYPGWEPGHYYSPVPSSQDITRAMASRGDPVGIDLRTEQQIQLAQELDLRSPELGRWTPNNDMFGEGDAAVLRAMLLKFSPGRALEVGSGFSTALMLDVAEQSLPDLAITCVEPHAERLRALVRNEDEGRLTLIEQPVQDLSAASLINGLQGGDFLFIDSTHVVKAGSDVGFLFFEMLPRLARGVIVHVHDIFWPFEYPNEWLAEGRYWSEAYLLRAFLMYNPGWEILFFNSWFWKNHRQKLPAELRSTDVGSIWLRRVH